jgi:hypothetical protein
MSDRLADLLDRAKRAIKSGEASLRIAAECIAKAQARGATQRQTAEAVGKSAAWVNQLLKWRSDGYKDATPFGPAKAQQRAKFRQSEQEKPKPRPVTTDEQARVEQARAEAAAERARAERAKHERKRAEAEARRAREDAERAWAGANRDFFSDMFGEQQQKEIHSSSRTILVKALGMLASEHDGEILAAARTAERERKKLDMSWDELIVAAAVAARRAA